MERLYDQMVEHGMPEDFVEGLRKEKNEWILKSVAAIDERLRESGITPPIDED